MVVIHWNINGATGHGVGVAASIADSWIEMLNLRWGAGTHWIQYCQD